MIELLKQPLSLVSSSPEETQIFAASIAASIPPGTIICLEGDLGSGKTTFSKGFISELTSLPKEQIQSPTFIYLNIYQSPSFPICHFDLYRLQKEEEFEMLGFLDYFDGSSLCLIEWPSKIPSLLPKDFLSIEISFVNEFQRKITVKASTGNPSC